MKKEVREIDFMDEVDQNPKAHEDSTAHEEMLLRDAHGPSDSKGLYGRVHDGDGSEPIPPEGTPVQDGNHTGVAESPGKEA